MEFMKGGNPIPTKGWTAGYANFGTENAENVRHSFYTNAVVKLLINFERLILKNAPDKLRSVEVLVFADYIIYRETFRFDIKSWRRRLHKNDLVAVPQSAEHFYKQIYHEKCDNSWIIWGFKLQA